MKVKDTSDVRPLRLAARSEPARKSPERDRVSVDHGEEMRPMVAAARDAAGRDHAARLRALKEAVDNGTYQPDPQRIAERILTEAELAARVRASMRHE